MPVPKRRQQQPEWRGFDQIWTRGELGWQPRKMTT